jgi:predicted transcriptional regulator
MVRRMDLTSLSNVPIVPSVTALTCPPEISALICMEVHLNPDMQAKLARLAAEQGRKTEALVQEAIARLVDYDEWYIQEVQKGLASADRGEIFTHEEVGRRLEKLIAEKQALR